MTNNIKRAILCPNCGKLISSDAEECIHCGMKKPGRFGFHSIIQKLFRGDIGFTQIVTYICGGLFIISIAINPSAVLRPGGFFDFLSPSNLSLFLLGGTGTFAMQYGRWWTLITAIYLHGSILHIIFNMLWIRQLAPMVEGLFGTARLITIFTLSGVLGFLFSYAMKIPLTIGASGSIFGLLGALIYYGRTRGGAFGDIVYRQLLTWAIVLFLFGFLPGTRINNWAHLGGFIGGYLSGSLMGYQEKNIESKGHRTTAFIMIAATALAFMFNFLVMLL